MPALIDDSAPGSLVLPDGRSIEFAIRYSNRARSARLRVGAREGLVVVVPAGLQRDRVNQLVASKRDWIASKLDDIEAIRHLIPKVAPARPQAFDLPALAESWRVEYREMRRPSVGAKTDRPGRIVVFGAVNDVDACHAALRRWLARRAAEALPPWLERVAVQCGQQPAAVAIKNQRTRWGSCAASMRISLNCKLLFLPRELVRYVMVHELCHLLEHNHSSRFWAHVRQMDYGADSHHGQMRDAWKFVPAWAQRGTGLVL
ncbi:M48 family metallopeptidase [Piscinibacter sp.]|uniref:M48 family metallopeptidase n=1 Tax=Piscinibacter sp. TaxID=1903157 RepID=UPI0039E23C2D